MTLLFVGIPRFHLLYLDWRGYLISIFALVWIANLCMSILGRLRLDLKGQRVEIETQEKELTSKLSPRFHYCHVEGRLRRVGFSPRKASALLVQAERKLRAD